MTRFPSAPLLAFALAVATGCEEKKVLPPVESAPEVAAVASELVVDAGALADPLDPPPPAGDLQEEIARFVNVEQCVAERAKIDPLVGDALGAIGYETFLRDACRLLEASKDRKRETCDKIDSSALRSRCQSWVAMIAQTPDACPMQFEGVATRGRNASCVAIASRDPRLCNGESRTVQRATCEAMVARAPAKCDALAANHRALCRREVARWHAVLAPPLEGLEKLPAVRGTLTVRGVSGAPDPPNPEVDLGADFKRGVVVVTARDRLRVELGTVVESEAARIAASPQRRSRVGLAVLFEPTKTEAQRPVLQKLEIELPGEAPLVSPPASCDCKLTARASATRGAEVAIALDGIVSNGSRTFKVAIDLATFVRDVVAELPGARVLPPLHPPVVTSPGLRARPALLGRDGG